MTRPLSLLYIVMLAVLAAATGVDARPIRVALTQLDDDPTGVGKAVTGALEDSDLEIVPGRRVSRAITRLGPGAALDDENLAKIAAELDVDAVVQCTFDRRTRRLRVAIFADGKVAKRFSVTARDHESEKFRKAVRSAMLLRLAAVVPAGNAGERSGRPRKGHRLDAAGEPGEPAGRTRGKARKTGDAAERASKRKPPGNEATDGAVGGAEDEARGAGSGARPDGAVSEAATGVATGAATEVATEAGERPARRTSRADDAPAGGDAAAARSARKTGPRDDEPDEAARASAPRVAARDDNAEDDADSALAPERATARTATAGHGANLAAIRLEAGASAVGRRLEFKSTAFAGAPPNYSNAPVPGARVAGELYPLALDSPGGWLAGFGVAGEYDQSLSITLRATGEMTVPLPITERSYSVGLRYRLAFGHRPTSPTLTFGAGYAARTFTVDRSKLMSTTSIDLPDVDYRMFDPGLSFRLPIGERVALTLGGRGLIVTSAGAIQKADQYGMARVYGASATAGLELGVTPWVAIRLAAEGTQIGSTFAGTGTLTNSRDGDSSSIDVRGVIDRYYGGTATLAIMY